MRPTLEVTPPGQAVRITGVRAKGALRRRLIEMGIVPGARIVVMRIAPLGDPMEIRIGRTNLSLRKREASTIEVAPADEGAGAQGRHRHGQR